MAQIELPKYDAKHKCEQQIEDEEERSESMDYVEIKLLHYLMSKSDTVTGTDDSHKKLPSAEVSNRSRPVESSLVRCVGL